MAIALQPRWKEILPLLAHGYGTRDTGKLLFLSHNTVRCYVNRMRLAFEVKNVVELVATAIRLEILVYTDQDGWHVNESALDHSRTVQRPYRRVGDNLASAR